MEAGRKQGKGDWLLFMEPGDILEPGAFYQICQKINRETKVKLIYSDSDKIDSETHTIFEPQFKPDDSPYTLQSGNYIGNSIWIHDKLAEEVGGIREGYGSQPLYDLDPAAERKQIRYPISAKFCIMRAARWREI